MEPVPIAHFSYDDGPDNMSETPVKLKRFDTPNAAIDITLDGVKQKAHHTWFRGEHVNFNPKIENMRTPQSVENYVLQGWAPPTPAIGPDTKVVAFGSCFAANITKWLAKRNFAVLTEKQGKAANAYVVRFGEGMVNTFVIRQQFEWALDGKVPEGDLWHGYDATKFGYDEDVRQQTRALFMEADVFIITLGLSEIWYDEPTGGVFWRAVPQDQYDPSRHKFRVSTVAENRDNIAAIRQVIRRHRPDAKVIFTLSPIPLVATFRGNSCITSNSVSKSILRSAIDEFLRGEGADSESYYWPSYEIVMDVFDNRWMPDRRHVRKPILDFIMVLFEHTWCHGSEPGLSVAEAWLHARSTTRAISPKLSPALKARDVPTLRRVLGRMEANRDRGKRVFQDDIDLVREAARNYAQRRPKSRIARWIANGAPSKAPTATKRPRPGRAKTRRPVAAE